MDNGLVARENFEKAVDLFYNSFAKDNPSITREMIMKEFRPGPSQLRLENLAVTTTNFYQFQVKEGVAPQNITESRLNQQDIFVITNIGFYLNNPTGLTDGAFKDFTYVNPFFFNVAMQAFYRGWLQVSVNTKQYIVDWPLKWHENINETQQTLAAGANSPVDQFNGNCDGKKSMGQFLLLQGQKNNEITINLPVACTAVTANSRVTLVFDGILFQNCTVVS